ncbi:SDR family oxidoreductase [Algoriphagus aestuarii]|nr:SDR family oxidoreductase [Algoriphagus aestuarii]
MNNLLILGAGSDVGVACAHCFAENGFNLILASRNVEELQKEATDIQIRHGVNAQSVFFDALDYKSHSSFYQSLPMIPDAVISVFGVLGDQTLAEKDFEHARNIIDSNFTGNVSILGTIANEMEKLKKGTIICVSSVAGERGRKSNYFYGASKAALTAFLSGLRARMFESQVHVMTVIPGFIQTKMIEGIKTPAPLTAKPEDVAKAIFKGFKKKKNSIYVLPSWRFIMLIIKMIPEFIFKKLNL